MHRDVKHGLFLGLLLVGIVGALFFRRDSERRDLVLPPVKNVEELDRHIAAKPTSPYVPGLDAAAATARSARPPASASGPATPGASTPGAATSGATNATATVESPDSATGKLASTRTPASSLSALFTDSKSRKAETRNTPVTAIGATTPGNRPSVPGNVQTAAARTGGSAPVSRARRNVDVPAHNDAWSEPEPVRPHPTIAPISDTAFRDVSLASEDDAGFTVPAPPVPKAKPASAISNRRSVQTHVVQSGETLSSIAAKRLGSSSRFPELFAANRHQLASPDSVPEGMELIIPDGPESRVESGSDVSAVNEDDEVIAVEPARPAQASPAPQFAPSRSTVRLPRRPAPQSIRSAPPVREPVQDDAGIGIPTNRKPNDRPEAPSRTRRAAAPEAPANPLPHIDPRDLEAELGE
jgi:nucleoid-associated protein YgaU